MHLVMAGNWESVSGPWTGMPPNTELHLDMRSESEKDKETISTMICDRPHGRLLSRYKHPEPLLCELFVLWALEHNKITEIWLTDKTVWCK